MKNYLGNEKQLMILELSYVILNTQDHKIGHILKLRNKSES